MLILRHIDKMLQSRVFVGTMSGTSADGVDVAVVQLETSTAVDLHAIWSRCKLSRILAYGTQEYGTELRRRILHTKQSGEPVALQQLCQLAYDISVAHADAVVSIVTQAGISMEQVAAIGLHGNTLFHLPPLTLQWCDPALVASLTGCDVVADFRRADCAAGGQGAPLVPFADYLLFRPSQESNEHGPAKVSGRILANLGGIANITVIPASSPRKNEQDGRIPHIWAFDTGPANCIVDSLVRAHAAQLSGHDGAASATCDGGGRWSALGTVHWPVVHAFLASPYVDRHPPKSTDVPDMLRAWQHAGGSDLPNVTVQDVYNALATAVACTACTLAVGMRKGVELCVAHAPQEEGGWEVVLSGGGVHNATLLAMLKYELQTSDCAPPPCYGGHLPGLISARSQSSQPLQPAPSFIRLCTSSDLGMPTEAKEAVAFALLAAATVDRVPGNVPSCTGASRPVLLGALYPAP